MGDRYAEALREARKLDRQIATFRIRLLGDFQVFDPAGKAIAIGPQKAKALLYEEIEQLDDEELQWPMIAGFYAAARSGQGGAA